MMPPLSSPYPIRVGNATPHLATDPDQVHRVGIILSPALKGMHIGDAHR